jgi:ribose transport system permease protein
MLQALRNNSLISAISWRDMGTLIGLILIALAFGSLTDVFFTERNLINILQQSSINACLAIGMTIVIISGGIDLSVGATAALTAVLSATLLKYGGGSPAVVIALAVLIGAVCGLFNGAIIAYAGLQPFIVTLGTLSIYRALALIYTGGNPVLALPKEFRQIFTADLLGLPVPVVLVGCLAVIASVILARSPIGEYIFAVGGNEEAARVSGVPIGLTKITAYVASGVLAASWQGWEPPNPHSATCGNWMPLPPLPSAVHRSWVARAQSLERSSGPSFWGPCAMV